MLVAGDRAKELCSRPAWIPGIDHRTDPHYPGVRDLAVSASTQSRGRAGGRRQGPIEVAELMATFSHEELILKDALGLGDDTVINPSGGALAAHALMVTGLMRIGEAFRQINQNGASRACWRTPRRARASSRTWWSSSKEASRWQSAAPSSASARPSTPRSATTCRWPGLVREAASRALDDAEMTWKDIDAVVIGKAPDTFEGVMMPELYLADALGGAGKPIMRVHTAGSVGGSTAIVASRTSCSRACASACSPSASRSSRRATPRGAWAAAAAAASAPAATSRPTSAPTSSARVRPSTSAGRWR